MTAFHENTQAVIGEATVAVRSVLDEFHLAMESSGDAVVFGSIQNYVEFGLTRIYIRAFTSNKIIANR